MKWASLAFWRPGGIVKISGCGWVHMVFVYERRVRKYEIRILINALGGTVLQSKEASSVSPGINPGVFFFSSLHCGRMPLSQPWLFLAVLHFCCCGSQPSNGYSSLAASFLSVNHFFEQRNGVPGNGVWRHYDTGAGFLLHVPPTMVLACALSFLR